MSEGKKRTILSPAERAAKAREELKELERKAVESLKAERAHLTTEMAKQTTRIEAIDAKRKTNEARVKVIDDELDGYGVNVSGSEQHDVPADDAPTEVAEV